MEKITQYLKICQVRPDYQNLFTPYQSSSRKRITFNLEEIELHYQEDFGIYLPVAKQPDKVEDISTAKKGKKKVKGSNEGVLCPGHAVCLELF
jgi:hypothetical protein